tara:strand:+ start:3169 stop:3615 length:447 start_codon:yes stop_codon:yes gene_type:complete
MNFNKVILMGRLTRDPILTLSEGGMDICRFGLAINRERKKSDGSTANNETVFVDVTAFDKQAKVIGQYLTKGSPIHFEGRLKFGEWRGEDGKTNKKLEVVLEKFQFVGGKQDGEAVEATTPQSTAPASVSPAASVDYEKPSDDDDVPF